MQQLSPKQKGDVSELRVLAKLAEAGVDIYLPYGEDNRSDVIIDTGDNLERVQIKTARSRSVKDTAIQFNCRSTRSNYTETENEGYDGDVDAFIVYWPGDDEYYYVPIEEAPKTTMTLRREVAENNQTDGINFAEDYALSEQV